MTKTESEPVYTLQLNKREMYLLASLMAARAYLARQAGVPETDPSSVFRARLLERMAQAAEGRE